MKVNDVARHAGLSPHTVRYYAGVGLLKADRDPANRYRRFSADALKRLRFVRAAKQLGFTLGEIREILDACDAGEAPGPMMFDIVRERLAETAARIVELERMEARLEHALARWTQVPGGGPSADAMCELIDSLGCGET